MNLNKHKLTRQERQVVKQHRTPLQVQHFLNALTYNDEPPPIGPTLRSFRQVVKHSSAHCMEAALSAATILEHHGFPPTVLSLESVDQLDHVMFVYQQRGRWGSVARSRDPGLHGRKPVFRTARNLALSYVEPYVDFTGRILGYAVVDLRELDPYDWRFSMKNVWKVERLLQNWPHSCIHTSDHRIERLRQRFHAFKKRYPSKKPLYFSGQEKWTAIPKGFRTGK